MIIDHFLLWALETIINNVFTVLVTLILWFE